MSKLIRRSTQPAVMDLLSGDRLEERIGLAFELVTVRPDGRCGVALLSVGEALAVTPTQWRLAVHAGSETARALREAGAEALASVIADGVQHAHDLRVRRTWELDVEGMGLLGVVADVAEVVVHDADYAILTGGPTYELTVPTDGVVRRWTETLTALRHG